MKKCDKFKEYFIFADEEKLKEHLENCPDCAEEYEKFEKISNLVKEVKVAYRQKKKTNLMLKVACFSGLLLFCTSFGVIESIYNFSEYSNYSDYLQESPTEEMGMPIDSYGLIKVD